MELFCARRLRLKLGSVWGDTPLLFFFRIDLRKILIA